MHKIYIKLYQQKVFGLKDLKGMYKGYQQRKNAVQYLLKKGLIKRIHPGLYCIVPLDSPNFQPHPLQIAMFIFKKDIYFTGRTALYLHHLIPRLPQEITLTGTRYMVKKTGRYMIICRPERQKKPQGIVERPLYVPPHQVLPLETTDLERTFIDTVAEMRTDSDVEETITLFKKTPLQASKMLEYLKKYKNKALIAKCGFFMEFKKAPKEGLDKFRKELSKRTNYLIQKRTWPLGETFKYVKQWRLMVPENVALLLKMPSKPVQEDKLTQ